MFFCELISLNLTLDADSSIKSIALSGKNLSVIYLIDKSTAATMASYVIFYIMMRFIFFSQSF